MISHEDLDRLAQELISTRNNAGGSVKSIEAWGIDVDALVKWATDYSSLTMRTDFMKPPGPIKVHEALAEHIIVGFEMGYKTALENEMRRISNETSNEI